MIHEKWNDFDTLVSGLHTALAGNVTGRIALHAISGTLITAPHTLIGLPQLLSLIMSRFPETIFNSMN